MEDLMSSLKVKGALALASFLVVAATAKTSQAAIIFHDDFESGTMANWTQTVATAGTDLVIDTAQNFDPAGGAFSAKMDSSADRMHHNIIGDNGGVELSGASTFTAYIYDAGNTASRIFDEVRGYSAGTGLPNGGTVASGALAQLLAIGKYNTVTYPAEIFSATKYQGRVTFGTNVGWFNLNGAGSPNRSVGWHEFTIERMPDDTTINFYVDGILSRTITGATVQSWDTVILGPGLGTTAGDAWIDGIRVATPVVPEPASIFVLGLGACLFFHRRNQPH
jgi:hypothetical protein